MLMRLTLCLVFSFYNNVTDLRTCKIRNRAVVLFALLALAINLAASGWRGLLSALGGGAVMLFLFPFFFLRMLGAGDVKALMAVGLMLGLPEAVWAMLYSLLGGGVIALGVLLFRKNGLARVKYFFSYCKICFLTQTLQPYAGKLEESNGGFRFSFGITLGLLALLAQTLGLWSI